jgi:hypothetical protein
MRHRGPDDEGYLFGDMLTGDWVACGGEDTIRALGLPALTKYERESYNLAFGHRRLSVLDLSAAGHGPMSYLGGQLWTTYNGEVYNYVELREELKGKGYSFRSGTDLTRSGGWPSCIISTACGPLPSGISGNIGFSVPVTVLASSHFTSIGMDNFSCSLRRSRHC